MSQLQIVEASAGSGKTHRLVYEYLRLLLINPDNYRHILAVTFTNKATEEMKSRIILELSRLQHVCNDSCAQPCNNISSHRQDLSETLELTYEEIAQRSATALSGILNNYSQFSIMTIDSFFQQVLRAFLREAGIGTSTRIELDTDWVIQQAVDQLLLELDTNNELYRWLVHYMSEQIAQGKSWNVSEKLTDMAMELLNEKFLSLPADYQQQLFAKDFRARLQLDQLYAFKKYYEKFLQDMATHAFNIMGNYCLCEKDFYGKSRGIYNFFRKLQQVNYDNLRIDPDYDDINNWPHSQTKKRHQVFKALKQGGLYECYMSIVQFIRDNRRRYNDTLVILKNIHTYGVLADVGHSIDRILQENDIQLLSKTTQFINELIGQNDVPFIYEKTGRFLWHFIIDEFQDTSYVQWQNFRPLINECLANDNFAMVVGDVKQSIYRWRNTDWTILEHKAEEDMHAHGTYRTTLDTNWRSLPEIVAFNNHLFGKYMASNVTLKSLYGRVIQKCAKQGVAEGMVMVDVNLEDCNDDEVDDENFTTPAVEWTIHKINQLLSIGYRQKDITILVRERKEGIEITEAINAFNQSGNNPFKINVLSAETALLTQCVAVNLILETFQYLLYPDDAVNLEALKIHFQQLCRLIETSISEKISSQVEPLLVHVSELMLNNPLDLFEEVIRMLHLNQYPPFLPYLQAFHNFLYDFCLNHAPQLKAFMDYWEHKKEKIALEISEDQDAVRILTIHKSKGLQFPNVIIPYCDWDLNYRGNQAPLLWCKADNTPLDSLQYFPIRFSQELESTSFAQDYDRERTQYFIDNINLLYVAFTRPMHHLFIYIPKITKASEDCKTVGDWVYWYVQGTKYERKEGSILHFQQGQLQYVDETQKRDAQEYCHFRHYPVYSPVGRIKQKSAFGGMLTPIMQYGNVMHRLFQHIYCIDDVEKAVDRAIADGVLSIRERESTITWLRQLLTQPQVATWFSREWNIYTEATVVAPFQHPYRPDRVMVKDGRAIVIDYKFGTKEMSSYKTQLKTYMGFLAKMGYTPIEGYLWYVQLGKIEKVAQTIG